MARGGQLTTTLLKSVAEIYLPLHPKATDFVSFFRFFLQPKKLKSVLILVLVLPVVGATWRRTSVRTVC